MEARGPGLGHLCGLSSEDKEEISGGNETL